MHFEHWVLLYTVYTIILDSSTALACTGRFCTLEQLHKKELACLISANATKKAFDFGDFLKL